MADSERDQIMVECTIELCSKDREWREGYGGVSWQVSGSNTKKSNIA